MKVDKLILLLSLSLLLFFLTALFNNAGMGSNYNYTNRNLGVIGG